MTDPDHDYGKAGAELVEKIASELGEDWLRLPGIEGAEKNIVVCDGRVSLHAGVFLFYLLAGTGRLGLSHEASPGRVETGHFYRGEFIVDRVDPAGDPALN